MTSRHLRNRYSRQTMFPAIGEEGQVKLNNGSVVIIGCGALGTNIATLLVRAGVGKVRITDRDFIEPHNLQRQVLFDEGDIKAGLPKAVAAEQHLRKVNSSVEIEGIVAAAPEYMEQKATIDAIFALALGLYTYVNPVPTVTGGPDLVKLLTEDCQKVTGGKLDVETDPVKAVDAILAHIEGNRKKLGI